MTTLSLNKIYHGFLLSFSTATPVRLVGGTKPSKGRIEVYHGGSWGSVCSDDFDLKDAVVICRTLGFMDR